jgi:hypothetical protein
MPDANLTIHDLLEDVELFHISFMELQAKREQSGDDNALASLTDNDDVDEAEAPQIAPEYQLAIDHNSERNRFRVRLRTEIRQRGHIVVEVAVEYEHTNRKSTDYAQSVINDFGRDVGIMAALPYAREAIADLTRRVFGSALLMPIIRRGDLEFDSD